MSYTLSLPSSPSTLTVATNPFGTSLFPIAWAKAKTLSSSSVLTDQTSLVACNNSCNWPNCSADNFSNNSDCNFCPSLSRFLPFPSGSKAFWANCSSWKSKYFFHSLKNPTICNALSVDRVLLNSDWVYFKCFFF